eukprot:TRINITY_DN29098_c0_g2_i1.p1 TRINITY_DN29098_c0_g2~~TRINITY_DN29098_c0_g2_i1.p1  ORF type:complete len:200 (+),score=21.44 TRINITY_DN29098_c0_g2_i1:106-705(+)
MRPSYMARQPQCRSSRSKFGSLPVLAVIAWSVSTVQILTPSKIAPDRVFQFVKHAREIPSNIDINAIQRKFIWFEKVKFQDEEPSKIQERESIRRRMEQLDEFAYLFELNDEDFENSAQGPEDSLLFAMQEQALIDSMSDGSIFKQERMHGNSGKRLIRPEDEITDPQELEAIRLKAERRQIRKKRSRGGKRGRGLPKK